MSSRFIPDPSETASNITKTQKLFNNLNAQSRSSVRSRVKSKIKIFLLVLNLNGSEELKIYKFRTNKIKVEWKLFSLSWSNRNRLLQRRLRRYRFRMKTFKTLQVIRARPKKNLEFLPSRAREFKSVLKRTIIKRRR